MPKSSKWTNYPERLAGAGGDLRTGDDGRHRLGSIQTSSKFQLSRTRGFPVAG